MDSNKQTRLEAQKSRSSGGGSFSAPTANPGSLEGLLDARRTQAVLGRQTPSDSSASTTITGVGTTATGTTGGTVGAGAGKVSSPPPSTPLAQQAPQQPDKQSRQKNWVVILLVLLALALLSFVIFRVFQAQRRQAQFANTGAAGNYNIMSEPLNEIAAEGAAPLDLLVTAGGSQFTVNGQFNLNGRAVFSSTTRPDNPQAGELWYQEGDNKLWFYDGAQFIDITYAGNVDAQIAALNNYVQGVVNSIQGQTGQVNVQGTANQITVTTAGGVITLSLPQDIAPTSTPQFAGINLTGTGSQNGNALCDSSNNCNYASATNAIVQGGNNFGTDVVVGASDNFGVQLITNGVSRVTVSNDGAIELGTSSTDRLAITAQITGDVPLVFQGATDDGFTTALAIADPSANQTIILPNDSGTVCLNSGNCSGSGGYGNVLQGGNAFSTTMVLGTNDAFGFNLKSNNTDRLTISAAGDIALVGPTTTIGLNNTARLSINAQILGGTPLVFQGATDDGFATSLIISDPTANRTIILPNDDGTICLSSGNCPTGGNGDVLQGGNNFGATMVLGTNDNFDLILKTNNTNRFTISNVGNASLTGDLSVAGNMVLGTNGTDRITFNGQIVGGTPLVFQGATDDGFATSLVVADPTASRTIILPNDDGTICLSSGNCSGTGGYGDVLQGGNNFGATMVLGTNDSYALQLKTANYTAITIDTSQNVGIGTVTPLYTLDIQSTTGHPTIRLGGEANGGGGYINGDPFGRLWFGSETYNSTGVSNAFTYEVMSPLASGVRLTIAQNVARTAINGSAAAATSTGALNVYSSAASQLGLQVQGAAGQTANLQEWQNSSGAARISVNADGVLAGSSSNGLILRAVNSAGTLSGSSLTLSNNGASFSNNITSINGGIYLTNNVDGIILQWPTGSITRSNVGAYSRLTSSNRLELRGDTQGVLAEGVAAGAPVFRARGSLGQTANLQEWQNDSGVVLASISAGGGLSIQATDNTTIPAYFATRHAAGASAPALVVQYTHSGNGAPLIVGRDPSGSDVFVVSRGGTVTANGVSTPSVSGSGLTLTSNGTNGTVGIGIAGGPNNIALHVRAKQFNFKGLVVSGQSSQTANLQEWQNNAGAVLASVNASGVGSFPNLLQAGNQVCDISNNCDYASASGSGNYIQNGTSAQTADFNITGNGTIGGALLVQGGISSPGTGTASEQFGLATASGQQSVALGRTAVASGSRSVVVGFTADATGQYAVGVGYSAQATSDYATAIGGSSSAVNQSVAVGYGAAATVGSAVSIGASSSASNQAVAVGTSAVAGPSSISIGHSATTSGFSYSIALGGLAAATTSNQLVIGGSINSSSAFKITQGYFGSGVTAASPLSFTMNATGGAGTDIAGANLLFAGGRGTGTGAGGDLIFQTAAAGSTGSSLNALSERMRITSAGSVGIGTVAPNYLFDVSGGAGVVGQFSGRVIGADAVNSNEFITLGQLNGISGNYIQNGTSAQTANFNITGNGTINGALAVSGPTGALLNALSATASSINSQTNSLLSPKNTVSVFVGSTGSTASYGVNESSGNIRFNGRDAAWGDFGYYPLGAGAGNFGQFRFSTAGASINSTPNAKVGVGELYSAGNVGIGTTSPGARLEVVTSNDRAAIFNSGTITAAGDIVTIQGNLARTSTNSTYGSALSIASSIIPSSGASNLSFIDINGTINQTGATGITRGIYVRPTLTAAADYRGIELANNSGFGIYQGGASAINYFNGSVGIGTNAPAGQLHVQSLAAGNTGVIIQGASGQTANLQEWQNSSGTVLASVSASGSFNLSTGGRYSTTASNAELLETGLSSNNPLFITTGNRVHLRGGSGVRVYGNNANQVVLFVQGASGQTANLQEWQNSAGTVLASLNATGDLTVVNATVNGNLTVTGNTTIAGTLTVTSATTFNNTLTVNGHIITGNTSGVTTIGPEAGAGSGASVAIDGNDTSGTITITTGTGASPGQLATIAFANAYGAAPRVTLTPDNVASASAEYYTSNRGTSSFSVSAGAPIDSTTYVFNYFVAQ